MSKEEYLKGHKASGLKVGDSVLVTGDCESFEKGWNNMFVGGMKQHVSKVYKICIDRDDQGFMLDHGAQVPYYYPYFILKKERKVWGIR